MEGLVNGRIVHYVMRPEDYGSNSCYKGTHRHHHRPAIVVENWGNNGQSGAQPAVNLMIFTDGMNDGLMTPLWRTSVLYSEGKEPGTFHWPEKE